MNITHYTFEYDPSRLGLFEFSASDPIALSIIATTVALSFLLYLILPYLYGYFIVRQAEQDKLSKRRIIQDLILMKEIQGELEREMEQALLNMALTDRTQHA